MKIPADVQIKATIKPGSVFYFVEEALSSDNPHYFIVLNHHPLTDNILVLVCSSSQIDKVKERVKRRQFPESTVVEIFTNEYPDFTKDSIIDCNEVFPRTLEQLIEKLTHGELKLKTMMGRDLIDKLRKAVLDSPKVKDDHIKNQLKPTT
jgi:hypothetical protein